jgi:hypothetical protein
VLIFAEFGVGVESRLRAHLEFPERIDDPPAGLVAGLPLEMNDV